MHKAVTISAEVVGTVNRLLAERGKTQTAGENFPAFVARGLAIAPRRARAFLGALQDGNSIQDAMLIVGIESKIAGIESSIPKLTLLVRIARAIGSLLGSAVAKGSYVLHR